MTAYQDPQMQLSVITPVSS